MNIAGYSGCIGRGVAAIRSDTSQQWINYIIRSLRDLIYQLGAGSTFPNVTKTDLAGIQIPMPPPHVQNELVSALEAERVLVSGNRELVERMQGKIQAAIGRVWGDGDSVQR